MHHIFSKTAYVVLSLAFAVRCYASLTASAINLDGIVYINQAKAIYHGQLLGDISCGLGYVPLNSFLTVPFYVLLNDWIIAARTVSLIFGFGAIVPVYLIAKRFFTERICAILLLLFGFIPVLVNSSAEIIKDPVSWFFFSFSLLFFVRYLEKESKFDLLVSGILFLIAGLARIELLILYLLSAVYILLSRQKEKVIKFLIFMLPLLIAGLLLIQSVNTFDVSTKYIRTAAVFSDNPIADICREYIGLQQKIKAMAATFPAGEALNGFLPEAANLVWLIGVGMLATHTCEAIFYPFVFFFLIGFWRFKSSFSNENAVNYFFLLTIASFLLLYMTIIKVWIMEYRWIGIMILSSFVFAGMGIKKTDDFFRQKNNRIDATIVWFVVILLFGFPKIIFSKKNGNEIFVNIASNLDKGNDAIKMAGMPSSTEAVYLVSFYANLSRPEAICPSHNLILAEEDVREPLSLSARLREESVDYFLVASESPGGIQPKAMPDMEVVGTKVGEWKSKEASRFTLYKVRQ